MPCNEELGELAKEEHQGGTVFQVHQAFMGFPVVGTRPEREAAARFSVLRGACTQMEKV